MVYTHTHQFNMPHAQQIWKSREIFNKQYIFGNYSTLSDRVAYLMYNKYISHAQYKQHRLENARGENQMIWRIGCSVSSQIKRKQKQWNRRTGNFNLLHAISFWNRYKEFISISFVHPVFILHHFIRWIGALTRMNEWRKFFDDDKTAGVKNHSIAWSERIKKKSGIK